MDAELRPRVPANSATDVGADVDADQAVRTVGIHRAQIIGSNGHRQRRAVDYVGQRARDDSESPLSSTQISGAMSRGMLVSAECTATASGSVNASSAAKTRANSLS